MLLKDYKTGVKADENSDLHNKLHKKSNIKYILNGSVRVCVHTHTHMHTHYIHFIHTFLRSLRSFDLYFFTKNILVAS